MTTITFTGNNYGEITLQIMSFMQQIGAKLMPPQPLQNFTPDAAPIPPRQPLAPVPFAPVAPAAAPIPAGVPVQPLQAAAPAPQSAPPPVVPTTTPEYTHDQLGRAVSGWIDKDRSNRDKALALLQAQGVQGVTQLDTPDKRSTFAAALRAQGVQV